MICPASSGTMSEAEFDQHDAPAPSRILEDASRFLARLRVATGGSRRYETESGLVAGHSRHHPERARDCVCPADHTPRHHVGRISDAATGVRDRGGSDTELLRHTDDGGTGVILADAGVVVDHSSRMLPERQIRGIAPHRANR